MEDKRYNSELTPDRWVVVRIENEGEVVYKLLMSWYGGYLDGDRWRMNSGIQHIEDCIDYYLISGYSGSVYKCMKGLYGMNSLASGIYNNMKEVGEKKPEKYHISIKDESTNWIKLEV